MIAWKIGFGCDFGVPLKLGGLDFEISRYARMQCIDILVSSLFLCLAGLLLLNVSLNSVSDLKFEVGHFKIVFVRVCAHQMQSIWAVHAPVIIDVIVVLPKLDLDVFGLVVVVLR